MENFGETKRLTNILGGLKSIVGIFRGLKSIVRIFRETIYYLKYKGCT